MPRHTNKLTVKEIQKKTKPGLYADGGGLYLQITKAYIDAHRASWKNAKHATQWANTLNTYASPILGRLPVNEIDTPLVVKVLEPIWNTKTETASRLRGRIEPDLRDSPNESR